MPRDNRPLLVSLLGTGFLLALVAANDPLARPRPTELLPAGTDAQGDEFRRPDVLPVYDFARLAPAIAGLLDGKRARFRVALGSPPAYAGKAGAGARRDASQRRLGRRRFLSVRPRRFPSPTTCG